MSLRRFLGQVVAVLTLIGLGFFFYPFIFSLAPSAKAKADVPFLEFGTVPVGVLTEIKEGDSSLFFYRNKNDEFLIFHAYRSSWGYFLWGDDGRAECGDIRLVSNEILCLWGDNIYVRWNLSGDPDIWWAPSLDMTHYNVVYGGIRYGDGA